MGLCGLFNCCGGAPAKADVEHAVAGRSDRAQVGELAAAERPPESGNAVSAVEPGVAEQAEPPSTPASAKTKFIFDGDEVKGLNNSGSKYAADRPVTIQTMSYEERIQLALEEEEAAQARRREREAAAAAGGR
jgi:hypothetical protein